MQLLVVFPFLIWTVATTTTPTQLFKRCSIAHDPELPRGYNPPAPCWQDFDSACHPRLAVGTETTVDAKHKLAIVYGVGDSCTAEVAEELAREADGRKNYGWVRKHGSLTLIKGGILIISGMSDEAVQRYLNLTLTKI
jgi:hypothetical protein